MCMNSQSSCPQSAPQGLPSADCEPCSKWGSSPLSRVYRTLAEGCGTGSWRSGHTEGTGEMAHPWPATFSAVTQPAGRPLLGLKRPEFIPLVCNCARRSKCLRYQLGGQWLPCCCAAPSMARMMASCSSWLADSSHCCTSQSSVCQVPQQACCDKHRGTPHMVTDLQLAAEGKGSRACKAVLQARTQEAPALHAARCGRSRRLALRHDDASASLSLVQDP